MYELYARGPSYTEMHQRTRENKHLYERFVESTPFRFTVSAYNHTIPLQTLLRPILPYLPALRIHQVQVQGLDRKFQSS